MEHLFTEIFTSPLIAGVASELKVLGEAAVTSVSVEPSHTDTAAVTALFTANNIWMMVATALVFIMHLGFASVESGFTQAKNTVNILYKNTLTIAIGLLTYVFVGFNLMYPDTFMFGGWFGFDGFMLTPPENGLTADYASGGYTYWTDFLFQGMFAATCATIVSGAVAERIKISAYMIFTLIYVGFIYPLVGSWKWGGGALDAMGFYDFAGSTLVHSVGGWAALAGIWVLGPRLGKYNNGKVNDFSGSSVPLATIGVFLLWLGWFGFNGGSVLSAEPGATSLVLMTTSIAAAAGAIGGMLGGYMAFKRLDFGMVLNGILAGLVGITAGADQMGPYSAIIIGLICGVVVVYSALFWDSLKLDDCVGAVSVHLVCGILGTLFVGIFGEMAGWGQLWIQLKGVLIYGVVTFSAAFLIFKLLDKTMGIRVSPEHEKLGMDSHEHGIRGYTIVYDE